MPQMLQCYKCNTQNILGMRFCTACGEKFTYKCPQCSAEIEGGSGYCSNCTVKLDWGISIEQMMNISSDQTKPTKAKQAKEYKSNQKEQLQEIGISPWLISFIVIVLLIVALLMIDAVF
jgi:hypothetical protein